MKIIDRKFIISLCDDYLDNRKTLSDLEKVASDILFLDNAPDLDPNEEELIRSFLSYLEMSDAPWNEYFSKTDILFYQNILKNFANKDLAIDLLYLLKYRKEIEELLENYLSNPSDSMIIKTVQDWNYKRAVDLFISLFDIIKNNPSKIVQILNSYRNGDPLVIASLLPE